MRVFKVGVFLSLAVAFSAACHSDGGNTNAPNANHASNANTRHVDPVISSNSNTSAQPSSKPADSTSAAPSKVDGAALFVAQKCVTCHGPDGKGKVKGT